MIKEYKDGLFIGEYGEEILDYDETEIITDVITYIAGVNIGTYDWELWDWAKDNRDRIEIAVQDGYYSIGSRSFDLMELFKAGQYESIVYDLYENLDDIVAYAVLENLEEEFINKKRLVEIIDDTCINVDNNRTVGYYIDIVKDSMEDYPMLEIHFNTGLAWTKSILVEGTPYDDLLELIDEYYLEHDELPVPMFTLEELLEDTNFNTEEEQQRYIDSFEMLPVNGGEFYIEGICNVEEVI